MTLEKFPRARERGPLIFNHKGGGRMTKKQMEEICSELGITMSTAFNIFAKKVIREKRIPFDVSIDPFYSESNMKALSKSIKELEEGKVVVKSMEELEEKSNE